MSSSATGAQSDPQAAASRKLGATAAVRRSPGADLDRHLVAVAGLRRPAAGSYPYAPVRSGVSNSPSLVTP
jgi:hypothetical protein